MHKHVALLQTPFGRTLSIFLALLYGLFVLITTVIVIYRLIPTRDEILMLIKSQLEFSAGAKVSIRDATGSPLNAIRLHDVRIGEDKLSPTGFILSSKRVDIKLNLLALLNGGRMREELIRQIEFHMPTLHLHRDDKGVWNFQRVFKPKKPARPPALTIRVNVIDGRIIYEDETVKLASGKALRVIMRGVRTKALFQPHGWISWEMNGFGEGSPLRFISARGFTKQDGELETHIRIGIAGMTKSDLPVKLRQSIQRHFEWMDGKASLNLTAKVRREKGDKEVQSFLKAEFKGRQLLIALKDFIAEPISAKRIEGSANILAHGRRVINGSIALHAATGMRQFGDVSVEATKTLSQFYSRITLHGASLRWLHERFGSHFKIPDKLQVLSGRVDRGDLVLRRNDAGKPINVDARLIISRATVTTPLLKRPTRIARLNLQCNLLCAPRKPPVGRATLNITLPSTDGITAAILARLSAWENIIGGSVSAKRISARLLNVLKDGLLPFSGRFVDGVFNISLALRAKRETRECNWIMSQIEISDVSVRQLKVDKVTQWQELFPEGADLNRIRGMIRYCDGLWQILKVGFSHNDFDAAISGAASHNPLTFKLAAKLFGVDIKSTWNAMRRLLPSNSSLKQLEADSARRGYINLQLFGTGKTLIGSAEIEATRMHLSKEGSGTAFISSFNPSIQFALTHDKPSRIFARLDFDELATSEIHIGDGRTDVERIDFSSPVELLGLLHMSKVSLQLGEKVRSHSKVSVEAMRIGRLILHDAHFDMDVYDELIELSNIEAKFAEGTLRDGIAVIEHRDGKELKQLEFSCSVERVKLSHAFHSLSDEILPPQTIVGGVASGKLSASLNDSKIAVAFAGEVESPMLKYEAAGEEFTRASEVTRKLTSADVNGNAMKLQMQLKFSRLKKSYKLCGGMAVASLGMGRIRLTTGDGRFSDSPITNAFVRVSFDGTAVDIAEVQCIAWDAKVRGWAKWDLGNRELSMQLAFGELNLSELNNLLKRQLFGRLDGFLTFTSNRSKQLIIARLSACNLRLPVKSRADGERRKKGVETKFIWLPYMTALLKLDGDRLIVDAAKVQYADADFDISGTAEGISKGLEKADLNLNANAKGVDIGKLLSELGVNADIDGVGSVEAKIVGKAGAPKVEAFVNVPLPLIGGIAFESLDGRITYDDANGHASASPLRAALGNGAVEASVKVDDVTGAQNLSGEFKGQKLKVGWLMRQLVPKIRVDGLIKDASGSISGTLSEPSLNANLSISDINLHGTEVGNAAGSISLRRLGRDAHSINLSFNAKPPSGTLFAKVSSVKHRQGSEVNVICRGDGLQVPWLEMLLESTDAALKAQDKKMPAIDEAIKMLSKLPHPLTGTARFAAACVSDKDEDRWQVECVIPDLRLGKSELYELNVRARGNNAVRHIDELRIAYAGATATCSGSVDKDGKLNLTAKLKGLRLSALSHFPKLRLPIDATVVVDALIHGTLDNPKLDITGEASDIRYMDLRLERIRLKSVKYDGRGILARRGDLEIEQAGQKILLWGKLPLSLGEKPTAQKEELDVHMQLIGAPITLVRHFMLPVDDSSIGHFNIDMHLNGTWEFPMLYGRVSVNAPKLCLMEQKAVLGDVDVNIVAEGRRVRIERCSSAFGKGKVSANGYIELGREALTSPVASKFELKADVSGVPITLAQLIHLGGFNASLQLQNLPDVNGPTLQLLNASLTEQPQALMADGFVQWHRKIWDSWEAIKPSQLMRRAMLANCNFNISLNKLRLRMRDAFEGCMSGRLTISNRKPLTDEHVLKWFPVDEPLKPYAPSGTPTLFGTITLHDGTLKGVPQIRGQAQRRRITAMLPALDVVISIGNNVELRNVQMSAPLRGQVVIKGFPSMISASGRLYADRGVLRLPGGVLRLVIADIQVNISKGAEVGTVQSVVNLNVEARGRVGKHEVTMYASGPLGGAEDTRWVNVKFTSTPPLAEQEIARGLLGITLPEEFGREEAYNSLIEAVAPTLRRAFTSTLGGGLAHAIGLEQLMLEGEETGKQRLGIGARISPNLYIRWYQGLAGQGSAIEVEQWLNRWVSFVWRQDERQRNEFRVQVHFQF